MEGSSGFNQKKTQNKVGKFIEKTVSCGCMSPVSSEENTPLDLDDHGGRTFLRVLLHLTMHDYPPLVSRALHLLFRHFSQRQEVLQAFKQVPRTATTLLSAKAVDTTLVVKL